MHVLGLGNRGDVAADDLLGIDVLLAHQEEEAVHPDVAAAGDFEVGVGLDRTGEDPEHRDAADEGVADRLEDVGEGRAVGGRGMASPASRGGSGRSSGFGAKSMRNSQRVSTPIRRVAEPTSTGKMSPASIPWWTVVRMVSGEGISPSK